MHAIVRKNLSIRISPILVMVCLSCGSLASAQGSSSTTASTPANSWKQVEDAMGRSGQSQPGDVIKFGCREKTFISCSMVSISSPASRWVHGQLSSETGAERWLWTTWFSQKTRSNPS